jgi:hypothetical protein
MGFAGLARRRLGLYLALSGRVAIPLKIGHSHEAAVTTF